MKYKEFKAVYDISMQDISRKIFRENRYIMQVKREQTAVNNLEKIFQAVFCIAREKGFQAMSMRDLSKKTGMSLGSLYAYFPGKKKLLDIIQTQGWSIIKKDLYKACILHESPREQLRAVIKAHIFLSELFGQWFYFIFMEARNIDTVKSMEQYTQKILMDILEKGDEKGLFRSMDHALTASMIKAVQQEWYLKRWKYNNLNISVDQYADHLISIVESFCIKKNKKLKT